MKNKYIKLAVLTAMLHTMSRQVNGQDNGRSGGGQDNQAGAQTPSADGYRKQRVSRSDLQVLFSYYTQDGNHSAITGGTGTELLHVYSPEFILSHEPDSAHRMTLTGGIDILTSASMDNIDFIKSSASRVSARAYVNPGYDWRLKGTHTRLGLSTGLSIESAYLSIPAGVSITHTDPSGSREWSSSLQVNFDDLRWGRLSSDVGHPVGLIYPFELRDTSWFSIYRRYSYNLENAFTQVINQRMVLAVFPDLVYQHGLLCTPYHRVYFNDSRGTERVERLPNDRWKFPLGLQLNYFAGRRVIIRTYYRFYTDNFGITAHTLQLELPVKMNPALSLAPLLRLYTQTAANYFKPYKQHDLSERWYTSDYDLSGFQSWKAGLTMRYAPQKLMNTHYMFNALSLRYAYYHRSDGLYAHTLSMVLEMSHSLIHEPKTKFGSVDGL